MRLCCKILSDNISFKPVEVSAGFFGYEFTNYYVLCDLVLNHIKI